MEFATGNRLTVTGKTERTARLLHCLEQGGEKIGDKEIGLRKPSRHR